MTKTLESSVQEHDNTSTADDGRGDTLKLHESKGAYVNDENVERLNWMPTKKQKRHSSKLAMNNRNVSEYGVKEVASAVK